MTIYNCYNTGTITASKKSGVGETDIGGITGRLREYTSASYCYNLGNVISTSDGHHVGGITGFSGANGGAIQEKANKIEYSYNSGNITSNNGTRVGGICGANYNYCSITDSYVSDTAVIKRGTGIASINYGKEGYFYGRIVGRQLGNVTNVDILQEMPNVYYVVNGLTDEKSKYWSKDNVNEPKLLWEK